MIMSYINLEDVNGNGILTVSESKSETDNTDSLICFYTEYQTGLRKNKTEIVYLIDKPQIPQLIEFLQSIQ